MSHTHVWGRQYAPEVRIEGGVLPHLPAWMCGFGGYIGHHQVTALDTRCPLLIGAARLLLPG